jgi:hypothetical protein
MLATDKRELLVVNMHDGQVVHRVNVTGKEGRELDKAISQLRAKIDDTEFYIEDTAAGRVE